MLPAVEKSPLSIETVMLVASSTDTSSLPCISDFNPFTINGIDLNYSQEELIDFGLKIASGKMKKDEIKEWFVNHSK